MKFIGNFIGLILYFIKNNPLTTVNLKEYNHDLFSITFNEKWTTRRFPSNSRPLEFYNMHKINGIIAISAYLNDDVNFHYDINSLLEIVKKSKENAKIINVSEYKAINYEDHYEPNTLQQVLLIGDKRIRLTVTLTLGDNNEKEVLLYYYRNFITVVNSIKIKN